jgi:hypothetical protein
MHPDNRYRKKVTNMFAASAEGAHDASPLLDLLRPSAGTCAGQIALGGRLERRTFSPDASKEL